MDPIADTLIRIKNGYLARKTEVIVPYSKFKEQLIKLLIKNGYLSSVSVANGKKRELVIKLRYIGKKPALTDVMRVSKPSLRVFVRKGEIPKVFGGLGKTIISTPKGLLTDDEARRQKIGGEVICKIW